MTWYAVHAVLLMRRIDLCGPISVYENIYLVQAANGSLARAEGENLIKPEIDADDKPAIDGIRAIREFVGIRKVVNVSNPEPLDIDKDRPISGTEITYSEFEVDSENDVQKFMEGKPLVIKLID